MCMVEMVVVRCVYGRDGGSEWYIEMVVVKCVYGRDGG